MNYAGIHGGTNCYGGNLYPNVIENESGVGTCDTIKRPDEIVEEIGGNQTNSISVYRLPGREDFKYIGCVKWNTNHKIGETYWASTQSSTWAPDGFTAGTLNIDSCKAEALRGDYNYIFVAKTLAGSPFCWFAHDPLPFESSYSTGCH